VAEVLRLVRVGRGELEDDAAALAEGRIAVARAGVEDLAAEAAQEGRAVEIEVEIGADGSGLSERGRKRDGGGDARGGRVASRTTSGRSRRPRWSGSEVASRKGIAKAPMKPTARNVN
jgi:hypothetical protein